MTTTVNWTLTHTSFTKSCTRNAPTGVNYRRGCPGPSHSRRISTDSNSLPLQLDNFTICSARRNTNVYVYYRSSGQTAQEVHYLEDPCAPSIWWFHMMLNKKNSKWCSRPRTDCPRPSLSCKLSFKLDIYWTFTWYLPYPIHVFDNFQIDLYFLPPRAWSCQSLYLVLDIVCIQRQNAALQKTLLSNLYPETQCDNKLQFPRTTFINPPNTLILMTQIWKLTIELIELIPNSLPTKK